MIITFLAKSVHIMVVLPQATLLSILFCYGKSVVLHLIEDLIKDELLVDEKRRKKLSTRWESNPQPQECVLYFCATTAP